MEILKEELASAVSAVYLSFDLWTSPNGLAILSLICYFIDKLICLTSLFIILSVPRWTDQPPPAPGSVVGVNLTGQVLPRKPTEATDGLMTRLRAL